MARFPKILCVRVIVLTLLAGIAGCSNTPVEKPAETSRREKEPVRAGKIDFLELVNNRSLFAGETVETTFEIHGIVPDEADTAKPPRLIAVAAPAPDFDPETRRLVLRRASRPVLAVLNADRLEELEKYNAVVITAIVRVPENPLSRELKISEYRIRATFPKNIPAPASVKAFE